jgi:hypothetical protein
MFKYILGATLALLLTTGDIYAQRGGRGGGGGFGGGRGGYGGYGGYGRGFYGGYGGWGYGWGYPGYGYGYGLGGYGYPYYGGYSYPYYGGYSDPGTTYIPSSYSTPDTPIAPYPPTYTPPINSTDPHSPTIIETGATSSGTSGAAYGPGLAKVTVIVPPEGQVWFNDSLNPPKNGSKWVYVSDKLDVGKTYVLNIKARWNENGQDKSYSIPLRMEAGDNLTMDLTKMR